MIVRLDDDDPTIDRYPDGWGLPVARDREWWWHGLKYLVGPRGLLSAMWNECYDVAAGDVFMHCGDDITFRTEGWDEIVTEAFPDDGIAFVHGHDLSPNGATLGTHGFLRREWIEVLGYFVPPYFSADCNDAWLTDVADMIDRRIYVPVVTEHHHFAFGKGPLDQTHQERLERHAADNVTELWHSLLPERAADAEKLRAAIG